MLRRTDISLVRGCQHPSIRPRLARRRRLFGPVFARVLCVDSGSSTSPLGLLSGLSPHRHAQVSVMLQMDTYSPFTPSSVVLALRLRAKRAENIPCQWIQSTGSAMPIPQPAGPRSDDFLDVGVPPGDVRQVGPGHRVACKPGWSPGRVGSRTYLVIYSNMIDLWI